MRVADQAHNAAQGSPEVVSRLNRNETAKPKVFGVGCVVNFPVAVDAAQVLHVGVGLYDAADGVG